MKDLLIQIAKALVDNPEQVRVNEIKATHTTVLSGDYNHLLTVSMKYVNVE